MLASGGAELAARVGFTEASELLAATLAFAAAGLANQRRVAVGSDLRSIS